MRPSSCMATAAPALVEDSRRRRVRPARRTGGECLPRDRDRGRRCLRTSSARDPGRGRRPPDRRGASRARSARPRRARAAHPEPPDVPELPLSGPTAWRSTPSVPSCPSTCAACCWPTSRYDVTCPTRSTGCGSPPDGCERTGHVRAAVPENTGGALRGELQWIASELGAIRDTGVMLERLDRHAGQSTTGRHQPGGTPSTQSSPSGSPPRAPAHSPRFAAISTSSSSTTSCPPQ